ncbi:DNA primase [Thermococci archaeon]|nr:MAG: DNA primase [Thermococci archaeon]RLF95502.1 MAG: DNA primase [Thermococci archaeon]
MEVILLKEDLGTTKYIVHAEIEANGVVERPDVVGAIFGQTEGLLGRDLDLRELQKTGRIGRINVEISSKGGKSKGKITIPSSMDKVDTALIAAALETIDRVGPCEAKIKVLKIEDVRAVKRRKIKERAIELIKMIEESEPESQELIEEITKEMRMGEITSYGPEKLPAGPAVEESDEIIVVEGRADVLNLLKHGIRNAIAVEGTNVPQTIIDLSKRKTVTAFVDGDRGGELILKELLQVAEVDYVARAPENKEVEELTHKEIVKALRNAIPAEQAVTELERKKPKKLEEEERKARRVEKPSKKVAIELREVPDQLKEYVDKVPNTRSAYLLDKNFQLVRKLAIDELVEALSNSNGIHAVIFDGVISQRLLNIAGEKGIEYLIGMKLGPITTKPTKVKIVSLGD